MAGFLKEVPEAADLGVALVALAAAAVVVVGEDLEPAVLVDQERVAEVRVQVVVPVFLNAG